MLSKIPQHAIMHFDGVTLCRYFPHIKNERALVLGNACGG